MVSGAVVAAYSCVLGREQIDERDAARRARPPPWPACTARAVELFSFAVWQIGIVQILVRDRREQHDPRRRLAVVLLRERVRIQSVSCCLKRRSPACPAYDSL